MIYRINYKMNKHIKLFEQFKGIESSLLESFLDNLEKESPETLKIVGSIDPEEPPQENEAFSIWKKWLELQIKLGGIIGKANLKKPGGGDFMLEIKSELQSLASESINWLNQKSTIDGYEGKMKNSQVVWFFYSLKEKLGGESGREFGMKPMYDLIKE